MVGDEAGQLLGPVALDQLLDALGHHRGAGHQGVDVADDLAGRAAVALDDAEHVALRRSLPVQADGRQQQPFGEGVVGQRGQTGHRDPADVGHVDQRAGQVGAPRPSAKMGRKTRMSLAWMPPLYGSLRAYTSPGRMSGAG